MNFVMMTRTPKGIRFECVEYVRMDGDTINYKRSYDQNVGSALGALIRVGRSLPVSEREDLKSLYERTLEQETWLQGQSHFIEAKGNRPPLVAVKDAKGE